MVDAAAGIIAGNRQHPPALCAQWASTEILQTASAACEIGLRVAAPGASLRILQPRFRFHVHLLSGCHLPVRGCAHIAEEPPADRSITYAPDRPSHTKADAAQAPRAAQPTATHGGWRLALFTRVPGPSIWAPVPMSSKADANLRRRSPRRQSSSLRRRAHVPTTTAPSSSPLGLRHRTVSMIPHLGCGTVR